MTQLAQLTSRQLKIVFTGNSKAISSKQLGKNQPLKKKKIRDDNIKKLMKKM